MAGFLGDFRENSFVNLAGDFKGDLGIRFSALIFLGDFIGEFSQFIFLGDFITGKLFSTLSLDFCGLNNFDSLSLDSAKLFLGLRGPFKFSFNKSKTAFRGEFE